VYERCRQLRTLIITSNGSVGLGFFTIVAFLVFRSRFIYALGVILIDTTFFSFFTVFSRDLFTAAELFRVLFLQFILIGFCAYVSYEQEKAYRRGFLLQEDYELEQERTQEVIDNIMPPYVTKQLRQNLFRDRGSSADSLRARVTVSANKRRSMVVSLEMKDFAFTPRAMIANDEGVVSILFCYVESFGGLIAGTQASPSQVVAILDAVWSTFDELCIKHGLQKMETVGKTYMACCGLQNTRKDHAHACAEMAEDIIALMDS
jgi:phospholipid-transporting ATPase